MRRERVLPGSAWLAQPIPGKILAELFADPGAPERPPGLPDQEQPWMVQFANRVVVPKHVLVRHLDGESVMLNLETEKYFGLDATGTRMWQLVTAAPSVDAAYTQLLEEFEVEPELLRTNLTELLSRLLENGLLSIATDNVGTIPAV